jgi:ribosomal protein S18 acetylase RimI-like enzyme
MDIKERIERWQRILDQGTSCTFIAENDDGKIVGFINGGAERTGRYLYYGELYAIYLLEDYQRQGLGKKLVLQLTEVLKEQKFKNMLVWVLNDNPSKRFYESLNPEKVDEKTINIGGVDLVEVAYGWSHLSAFVTD